MTSVIGDFVEKVDFDTFDPLEYLCYKLFIFSINFALNQEVIWLKRW